jgi:hypothetical protein
LAAESFSSSHACSATITSVYALITSLDAPAAGLFGKVTDE